MCSIQLYGISTLSCSVGSTLFPPEWPRLSSTRKIHPCYTLGYAHATPVRRIPKPLHASALSQSCCCDLESVVRHLSGCGASLRLVSARDRVRCGRNFAITSAQRQGRQPVLTKTVTKYPPNCNRNENVSVQNEDRNGKEKTSPMARFWSCVTSFMSRETSPLTEWPNTFSITFQAHMGKASTPSCSPRARCRSGSSKRSCRCKVYRLTCLFPIHSSLPDIFQVPTRTKYSENKQEGRGKRTGPNTKLAMSMRELSTASMKKKLFSIDLKEW